MSEVTLRNISKSFGKTLAVAGVSMTIPDGAFVVLLGPTGAGKTTTLRLISGLETPDRGEILIDGRPVAGQTPAQRDVAMVFQQYSLYPHLTVRENLAFPLRSPILRTPEDEIARKIGKVAEVLHISHKLDNKATQLSGGEMQRVSIGRALVREPSIYLMDEPLSSLDAKLRADLRVELKRIQPELGRDVPLRHPRPDRGDDDGDPCRRPRSGPVGPVRPPARDLRKPRQPLCRDPSRPATDQCPARVALPRRARRSKDHRASGPNMSRKARVSHPRSCGWSTWAIRSAFSCGSTGMRSSR